MPQITFFPLDLDIVDDPRIGRLTTDQGGIALSIYILILTRVYAEGYAKKMSFDDITDISSLLHCKRSSVIETMRSCFRLGLFTAMAAADIPQSSTDEPVVVTSPSIQRRYIQMCQLMGIAPSMDEHRLIDDSIISGRFPPTIEDVKAEISAHSWGGLIDPSVFMTYYDGIGWQIKGEPITDWRAKLSKWVDRRIHPQRKAKARREASPPPPSAAEQYKPKQIPKQMPIPQEAIDNLRKLGVKID